MQIILWLLLALWALLIFVVIGLVFGIILKIVFDVDITKSGYFKMFKKWTENILLIE